ncbi:MAG: hypothetical protein ACYDA0_00880 [Candidatus Dormibacteraceae bacterium]
MDVDALGPYTSERWILESHEAVVRAAERRARLKPEADRPTALNGWVAGRLRQLADRLDGWVRLERAAQ